MARNISQQTKEGVRQEFNQYVEEINQQIAELEREMPDSIAIDRWKGYFYPIDDPNLDYNTMRRLRSQARSVLESGQLSVESVKRSVANAIETLHREGYDYINRRNFNSFMRFLDDARARGLGALYSSTQLIEKIHEAKKRGLTKREIKKNIARWADQIKRDKEGKVIEVVKPKRLTLKRY